MNKKSVTAIDIIKPESFFSNNDEKKKINWFCFELSMAFYDNLQKDLGKQLKKNKISEFMLADFSVRFSKNMKNIILQKLSGQIREIIFSYELIELCFPNLSDRLTNKMLKTLKKAWEEMLDFCTICPNRCISEKDEYCILFDAYYSDSNESSTTWKP